MRAFAKLNKENPRPKGILVKLYGWDECLVELFFPNRKEESLRQVLPGPGELHSRLGLHLRSFKTRNIYNKLKLFLGELVNNNRKHQEVQGTFMKLRL